VKVTRELGSAETRRRRSILVAAELTGNGGRGKFDGESELAWLGLRSRFREATGEAAW
jgi:hypothetical protein